MAHANLSFHQTFKPERQFLSSILVESESCSGLDILEISNLTGIPTGVSSGKVEPSIAYAEYMGLVSKSRQAGKIEIRCTPLGECIKTEDPGFFEKLTLLIMHCMITRPWNGAALWSYIFQVILPRYHFRITANQFSKEIELHFGPGVKMAPFNGCYLELFQPLGLLHFDADNLALSPIKIDPDFVYLYAFVLFTYWDEWLANSSKEDSKMASAEEITANHLNMICFRNPFGWDERTEYQVLELMAANNLIALNRQMVPFTVRRTTDLNFLLQKLYSELC